MINPDYEEKLIEYYNSPAGLAEARRQQERYKKEAEELSKRLRDNPSDFEALLHFYIRNAYFRPTPKRRPQDGHAGNCECLTCYNRDLQLINTKENE